MVSSNVQIEDRRIDHDRPLAIGLLARLLGVSRVTVYAMLRDGRLPGRRISDLLAYCVESPGYKASAANIMTSATCGTAYELSQMEPDDDYEDRW